MKPKILLIAVLMFSCNTALTQTVYYIKYNFNLPDDKTEYHACFTRYDDGSGMVRIRFQDDPASDEICLFEADLQETPVPGNTGLPDSNMVIFKTGTPKVILGNRKLKTQPAFVFRFSSGSEFIEPSTVIPNDFTGLPIINQETAFTAELMAEDKLNRNFVALFFSDDEDFYANLFKPLQRGLSPLEKNTKLHLLVVTNVNDATIGNAVAKDKARCIETFNGLVSYLGIKMIVDTISGKNYSRKSVEQALQRLKPAPNDIVVFYYSGHGFRKKNDGRKFPWIDLRAKPADNYLLTTMNMEDVFKMIQKKGARFNLVLSDCCNSDVEAPVPVGTKPFKTKGSGIQWNEDNCRALFLNKTRMSVLATAAENGQKAGCNMEFGSFFSFFFKGSMENYCSRLQTNVSWDKVFQDAKKQTSNKAKHTYCDKPYIPANICVQDPVYIVR